MKYQLLNSILLLTVGLSPIVWYGFATNHSAIHAWFTNKACVVSYLAVLFALNNLVGNKCTEENIIAQDSGLDTVL